MSDARWIEILDDVNWAVEHFSRAVEIDRAGGFEGEHLDAYKARMALMQAMQAGHTSLEAALERILEMLGEEKPTGASYHADLIRRVSRPIPNDRPAILDADLAAAVDETHRFRHVARKNYNSFRVQDARSAIRAAERIRDRFPEAIRAFRGTIDGA
ncbi:hypothetical protein [Methylobacterium dankookense]|uniref:HepT-like domain-containing protein n=1 Tax=Methylobacterium dankookense TaxID=560405 RepID=A0A564FW14_9HYPH|nr:hypothetical protein [Methylobacterium dankookense]GJD57709.1 hypothetical protein IFDJLNFL_3621 [Methylobacterium dankookense]VUF12339.1 hypothetical protein MTDSW087_02029 [Methylobacterium dankookense]